MQDTSATPKVASTGTNNTEKVSPDLLGRLNTDSTALEVLDIYRALTDAERERVYRFVSDAPTRQSDPDAARRYRVLEAFECFAEHYDGGDGKENICRWLDLTPNQYERYERAWQSTQAIHDEVEAFCQQQYGSPSEAN